MRGCYDEPGHWGSVALPIPYRVHAIGLWGQPFAIAAVVSEVSIPYRVHAIFVNADGWTAWDLFQFLIGFM